MGKSHCCSPSHHAALTAQPGDNGGVNGIEICTQYRVVISLLCLEKQNMT